jgi:hypothetical protein
MEYTELDMLETNIEWAKDFLAYCIDHEAHGTVGIVRGEINRMEEKLWELER